MNTKKFIKGLREKCKDKSDHYFVDAMESITTELEKPREPEDPYRFMPYSAEIEKAISDYCKQMGYTFDKKQ